MLGSLASKAMHWFGLLPFIVGEWLIGEEAAQTAARAQCLVLDDKIGWSTAAALTDWAI